MTEPDRTEQERATRRQQGLPRWVIGFIVVAVVLAALVVLMLALGHRPRQHTLAHMSGTLPPVSVAVYS